MSTRRKEPFPAERRSPLTGPPTKDETPTLPPPFSLERLAREHMDRTGHDRRAPSNQPTQPPPVSAARVKSTLPARRTEATDARNLDMGATRNELRERFLAHDYSGALELAEKLSAVDPKDGLARNFADECRQMLEAACLRRIGSLNAVPVLTVPLSAVPAMAVDRQAAFFLSQVDGTLTLEMLIDISPMRRLDVLRLACRLVDEGVLRLR